MDGGLKSIELEVSVPRRDLLGVSGLIKDWSPADPNIMLERVAGVLQRAASAFRAPCNNRSLFTGRNFPIKIIITKLDKKVDG